MPAAREVRLRREKFCPADKDLNGYARVLQVVPFEKQSAPLGAFRNREALGRCFADGGVIWCTANLKRVLLDKNCGSFYNDRK